jgi:hypothetical protein
MVTVELQLGGANVSINTKVVSAPMMVNCVQ